METAMVLVSVAFAICIVLGFSFIFILREELGRAIDRINKLERVLVEVEYRSCVYFPSAIMPSGYCGTAGGFPNVLGGTLLNDCHIPLRTYVTAIFKHLGLYAERIPASDSQIVIKTSGGGSVYGSKGSS